MKIASVIVTSLICIQLFACSKSAGTTGTPSNGNDTTLNQNSNDTIMSKMKITVGSAAFTATFYNNATAAAFKALLPLTINMNELNGNEKYFNLASNLPANPANPGTISSGDIMLYQSNVLVLFYKSFSTPYTYTKIGTLTDASGLEAALGSGNVTVTIELE